MWHANEDVEEQVDQVGEDDSQQKKNIYKKLFQITVIVLAFSLSVYFTFILMESKIYERARTKLLKSQGTTVIESQESLNTDNLFGAVAKLESIVRG